MMPKLKTIIFLIQLALGWEGGSNKKQPTSFKMVNLKYRERMKQLFRLGEDYKINAIIRS